MKKLMLTLSALAVVSLAIAQFAMNDAKAPAFGDDAAIFEWNATAFEFGKIPVNVPVSHEFKFTNTGSVPLIISSAQASCGCTVTSYSKDPIAPGGEGFVTATYNAAKVGRFSKTVTVNSNSEQGVVVLSIVGEVTE